VCGASRPCPARSDRLTWLDDTRVHDVRAQRDPRSGESGRELPEDPTITGRSTPQGPDTTARERVRTLKTQKLQFIVDQAGMQVQRRRMKVRGEIWEEYHRVQWPAVTAIGLDIGRDDSVVALYACTATGRPHHLADSRSLDTSIPCSGLNWAS